MPMMRKGRWRRPNLQLRLSSSVFCRQKGKRKRKEHAAAGHVAEMEEEEPSSLESSIERNTGGGQKRKRKDPDFIEIGSGGRIGMLESIESVIKCINSVVCFPYPADGMGFKPETVTLEERRIAGLIYSNVCTHIILYHCEKKRTVDNSSLIKDMLAGDGHVLTDYECVGGTIRGVRSLLGASIRPLLNCRCRLVDTRRPSVDIGNVSYNMFNTLRDDALGRHKQELMDVLHTLEAIVLARGHAPPEDGKEILLYKQIRKQIASFILHARNRDWFRNRSNYPALASPFSILGDPHDLRFVPPTLQLEVALEHMPEHHALLREFMQRATQQLSSPPTPVHVMFRDLVDVMAAKDASRSALLAWMPKHESFVTTRSACLDRIIAISGRIKPFGEQTPTEAEVRMYALIGEHVRSSLWLSTSRDIGKRSCVVYLANASTDVDHGSLSNSDAHGESECTREQLLEQIMPYLRALKSSCMDDAPSREEEDKYHAIWGWLLPGLLVCMCSRPMPHVDENASIACQVSELEPKVSFIYNKVLSFLASLKEGIPSVAAALHHAMLPEQQLSPQDALDWFVKFGDDAWTKGKEFVDRSMSDGTMAHLDHSLVALSELLNTEIFFSKLSVAVYCVDVKNVETVEDRAMVESEVQNALDILCTEQPLVE